MDYSLIELVALNTWLELLLVLVSKATHYKQTDRKQQGGRGRKQMAKVHDVTRKEGHQHTQSMLLISLLGLKMVIIKI